MRSTLYQSLIRANRFDLVLEKGTEIGVSRFVPVITARSQVQGNGEPSGARERALGAHRRRGGGAVRPRARSAGRSARCRSRTRYGGARGPEARCLRGRADAGARALSARAEPAAGGGQPLHRPRGWVRGRRGRARARGGGDHRLARAAHHALGDGGHRRLCADAGGAGGDGRVNPTGRPGQASKASGPCARRR